MIFGDPKEFAIEVALTENPTRHFFAHICLWADAKRIGLYEDVNPVGVSVGAFRRSMKYAGDRCDDTISNLGAEKLIEYLMAALFEDISNGRETLSDSSALMARYNRFCFYSIGVAFDGWDIVLIETADYARLIWRENGWRGDRTLHETTFPIGTYERVVGEFLNWANSALC